MPKPWKKNRKNAVARRSTPRTLHTERVVEELDLHGLTADAAERRLEMFLDRVAVSARGEVVRVITGRGARSPGPPVLQGLVREAVTGRLAHRVEEWAVDVGGGAYLLRMKG